MKKRFHWNKRYNSLDINVPATPKLLQETRISKYERPRYENLSIKDIVIEGERMIEVITKKAMNREETYNDVQELFKMVFQFVRCIKRSSNLTGIVEWLVKYGNENIRDAIVTQLKFDLDCMSRSKHCVGCVISMLENSSQPLRDKIITSFLGSIVRLINHPVSSPVIDLAYTKHAGTTLKIFMKQELYGPTFKRMRDELIDDLNQALGRFPTKRNEILKATKANLKQIIELRRAVAFSIFHDVLFDYLRECSQSEKYEMIEALSELSPLLLLNSKEGSYVLLAMMELAALDVRQKILEALLPYIIRLSMNDDSYLFTIAVCFALNPFKSYQKRLADTFVESSSQLALDKYGSCVLLYLLAPQEKLYLKEHKNETLKDIMVQQKIIEYGCQWESNILKPTKDLILFHLIKKVPLWLSNECIQKVSETVLRYGSGLPLGCAFKSITNYILELILCDKSRPISKSLHEFIMNQIDEDRRRVGDEFKFSHVFVTNLSLENIKKFKSTEEGSKIIQKIIQSGTNDVIEVMKTIIENSNNSYVKPYFGPKQVSKLTFSKDSSQTVTT